MELVPSVVGVRGGTGSHRLGCQGLYGKAGVREGHIQ